MGKIAFAFALCAATAFAATYKDFYRVDDWKDPELNGTAYCVDPYGNMSSLTYKLVPDENGQYHSTITDPGGLDFNSVYWTAIQASLAAAEAMAEAKLAQAQTDTFAKRLAQLLVTDGFSITDPNGDTRTVRLNAGSLGQALAGSSGSSDPLDAKIDKPFTGHGDGKTIEDDGTHLRLFGSSTATASTDEWWNDYGFFVPFLKGTGNLGWKKYGGFDSSVFDRANPVTSGDAKLLTLKGWYGDSGQCTAKLSDMLTKDESQSQINRNNHFLLAQYTAGQVAALHYVPIGDLISAGGAPVDDESITTNSTDGASTQGVASLYGWKDADENHIPQKGDGALKWTAPADLVDGTSIATTDKGQGVAWEVKDAHSYAGTQASHYFGTGADASLGWHELPNVTTNMVMADEVTLTTDTDPQTGNKVFGLKGWEFQTGTKYLAFSDGVLTYLNVPIGGTNGAPVLVDQVSISSNETGEVEIKGFAAAETNCSKDMADLLVADSDDSDEHQFLARAGTGTKSLHYVSVARLPHPDGDYFTTDDDSKKFRLKTTEGKFLFGAADNGFVWVDAPGVPVDGVSIVTNANGHVGQASIAGFWDGASAGDVLTRTENGVEWKPSTGDVDDTSIVTNRYGKLGLKGYENATEGDFPVVGSSGSLTWANTNMFASAKFSGSFSYFNGHIHDGCVIVGRTPIFVSGMDASNGDYRIRVTVGTSPTAVLEQGNGFTGASGTTSYIPVYTLSDGEIVGDYRGSFVVPSYE